jgi:hypothetical protein
LFLNEKIEKGLNNLEIMDLISHSAIIYSVRKLNKIPLKYNYLLYGIISGICFPESLISPDILPQKYRNFIMRLWYPECSKPIPDFNGNCDIYHGNEEMNCYHHLMKDIPKTFKKILKMYMNFYFIQTVFNLLRLKKLKVDFLVKGLKDFVYNVSSSTSYLFLHLVFSRSMMCLHKLFNLKMTPKTVMFSGFISSFPVLLERIFRVKQINEMVFSYYIISYNRKIFKNSITNNKDNESNGINVVNQYTLPSILFILTLLNNKKIDSKSAVISLISGYLYN